MLAIPEHPDLAKQRRRERWAVVFALGGIVIFFGASLYVFAWYAQNVYWKGRIIPESIQASINQEYELGYVLMTIGVAVTAAGYGVWLYLRRRAKDAVGT